MLYSSSAPCLVCSLSLVQKESWGTDMKQSDKLLANCAEVDVKEETRNIAKPCNAPCSQNELLQVLPHFYSCSTGLCKVDTFYELLRFFKSLTSWPFGLTLNCSNISLLRLDS